MLQGAYLGVACPCRGREHGTYSDGRRASADRVYERCMGAATAVLHAVVADAARPLRFNRATRYAATYNDNDRAVDAPRCVVVHNSERSMRLF